MDFCLSFPINNSYWPAKLCWDRDIFDITYSSWGLGGGRRVEEWVEFNIQEHDLWVTVLGLDHGSATYMCIALGCYLLWVSFSSSVKWEHENLFHNALYKSIRKLHSIELSLTINNHCYYPGYFLQILSTWGWQSSLSFRSLAETCFLRAMKLLHTWTSSVISHLGFGPLSPLFHSFPRDELDPVGS